MTTFRCPLLTRSIVWSVSLVVSAAGSTRAAGPTVEYTKQIKPLLVAKCARCHGALKQESGLRLDSIASIRQGGDRGPALVAGKSADSLVVKAVHGKTDFEKMPLDGKPLTADEISLVSKWIDEGASAPADDRPVDPRDHWAFQTPTRPSIPEAPPGAPREWSRGPIDRFIAVEHERRQLKPRPEARKDVLLRRLYLDLVGLAPTADELRAFLEDDSPDAYERIVDRLLATPAHAERWARHWMDVWRYSDWAGWTGGGQIRDSQPHIWRWRDWIIESLAQDKGYDRMILEMLAADELPEPTEESLRATGFLVRNYKMLSRETWMQDVVEHTWKGFQGLTMSCTRCHDHMYDPLLHEDYYRARAFFEPHQVRTDRLPGQPDPKVDGLAIAYDADVAATTYVFTRGDDRFPDKKRPMKPELPRLFASAPFQVSPVSLPANLRAPDARPRIVEMMRRPMVGQIDAARTNLAARATEFAAIVHAAAQVPQDASRVTTALDLARRSLTAAERQLASFDARAAADQAKLANPAPANIKELAQTAARAEREADLATAEEEIIRQEQVVATARREGTNKKPNPIAEAEKKLAAAKTKRDEALKKLAAPGENYTALGPIYPAQSTGRRLALAKWFANRENPLTARVAVNQLWLRHFGKALVPTVFDFGRNGKPPINPPLLNWLAVEFSAAENGWSMKRIHRQIVSSSVYRLAATSEPGNLARDVDNIFQWRWSPRRLEAESVRDLVLDVAGDLDRRLGGADIDCAQGENVLRRSLYFRHAPEKQMEFLLLFDAAAPTQCYERRDSVMPQQALALVNSKLTLQAARRLAREMHATTPDAAPFIAAAFERVLSRGPTAAEMEECRSFLAQQAALLKQKQIAGPELRARENLVHALFSHHEFVTVN